MTPDWEKAEAMRHVGNLLSSLEKLELCEWDLLILILRDWSIYAQRR